MSRTYQTSAQPKEPVSLQAQILTCRSKRRYPDEVTARANASIICEEFSLEKVSVYPCPHCRGWHVTRDNKGARGRVTAEETVVQQTHPSRHQPQAAQVKQNRG